MPCRAREPPPLLHYGLQSFLSTTNKHKQLVLQKNHSEPNIQDPCHPGRAGAVPCLSCPLRRKNQTETVCLLAPGENPIAPRFCYGPLVLSGRTIAEPRSCHSQGEKNDASVWQRVFCPTCLFSRPGVITLMVLI